MLYSLPRDVVDAGMQVFVHDVDGKRVYVKKRRPNKNPLGRMAQNVLYFLTGNLLVMPPDRPEGDNVSFEAGVLRKLGGLGVPVPEVLHLDSDYFVMSDVGKTLEVALREEPGRTDEYIEKAVRALRRFHDMGLAHGGAQIKNLTVKDGDIYFIDFEENIPDEHLAMFQVRDLFLFLLSLERHGHDPDLTKICGMYGDGTRLNMLESIRSALSGMRLTRVLNSRLFKRLSMRDIRSLNRLIHKADAL